MSNTSSSVPSSNTKSTNVGEAQQQVEAEQRRQRLQTTPSNVATTTGIQQEHLRQHQEQLEAQRSQQPSSHIGISQIGSGRIITTATSQQETGAVGTQIPQLNIPISQQQQRQDVMGGFIREPTIDLFNRFVAKDTHCLLGKTGIKLSRVCLGTMNFGNITSTFGERPGQLDEAQAHTILDRFVKLGGNCIDTADFFPWFGPDVGKTEKIIGNWLTKQDRQSVFLITKVRMPLDIDNINSVGLSRGHLIDSIENSLKRLQTDTIDMLVLNGWDPTVSFHETVRHLDEMVKCEKIRYIGVCDMKGWQLQKFIDAAKLLNMHKCVCYMGEYNLLTRGCELEVIDVCKNERIGFIAYSPLKYGFLTEDTLVNINNPPQGSRIEAATRARVDNRLNLVAMAESYDSIRQNPVYFNVLNLCQQLSLKYKVSISQVAIQWILQKGVVTSVCVGVEDVKELEENMSCLIGDFFLTPNEMDQLDLVSGVHLHYPYRCQLAEVAGFRVIKPLPTTEFEQLNVLTHCLELDTIREQPFYLGETWHEGVSQPLPEREFLKYPQMKGVRTMQTQLQSQLPQVAQSGSLSSGIGIRQPSNLIDEAKVIQ